MIPIPEPTPGIGGAEVNPVSEEVNSITGPPKAMPNPIAVTHLYEKCRILLL